MEILHEPAPPLAVDIHRDSLGVCVSRRGRDGNAGGHCHYFEGWGFETDARGYAEGEGLGCFGFGEAGALDDSGDLFAAAVAGCAEVVHGDGEVVVLRTDVSRIMDCGIGSLE